MSVLYSGKATFSTPLRRVKSGCAILQYVCTKSRIVGRSEDERDRMVREEIQDPTYLSMAMAR
jgi:hypothetical protein